MRMPMAAAFSSLGRPCERYCVARREWAACSHGDVVESRLSALSTMSRTVLLPGCSGLGEQRAHLSISDGCRGDGSGLFLVSSFATPAREA
jgi:hypothetical protein